MESKIIDSDELFFNAEECTRLSYEMLFREPVGSPETFNGNGHAGDGRKENGGLSKELLKKRELEWQQELEKARETAYEEGLEEGKRVGQQHALETIDDRLAPVKQALQETNGQISDLMEELKPHMATMVFDLAEKVVGLPVKNEKLKERVASEIKHMLEALESEVHAKILIAQDDYEMVSRAMEGFSGSRRIDFRVSEELNPGEYTIDTRNERIVRNFKKMLHDFRERVALTADHDNDLDMDMEAHA